MGDGGNLEIECKVDANPPAQALWKPSGTGGKFFNVNENICKINTCIVKGGSMSNYTVNGNKLNLTKISGPKMDGKEFQCTAMNIIGAAEVVTITLSVKCKFNYICVY